MEEALKQSAMRFAAGEIVKGTIIEVRPKEVLVDIGYKSEGVIPAVEFEDIKTVKVGDEIDVLIEKLEDKDGMVGLSKEKAEFKKNWEKILQICNEGGTVAGEGKAVVAPVHLLEPGSGPGGRGPARDQHAHRAMGAPPHPPTELVELGEAEAVGVLDHHERGIRHVHPHLDHRGRDQGLHLTRGEALHHLALLLRLEPSIDQPEP